MKYSVITLMNDNIIAVLAVGFVVLVMAGNHFLV